MLSKYFQKTIEYLQRTHNIDANYQEFFILCGLNVFAFLLFLLAAMFTNVLQIFAIDTSRICLIIVLIFVADMFLVFKKTYEYNSIKNNNIEMHSNMDYGLSYITWLASSMVMLGLLGTVVGFAIAFAGIDITSVNADNASKMLSNMSQAMGMAFYTTIVGTITNMWTLFCVLIMKTARRKAIQNYKIMRS